MYVVLHGAKKNIGDFLIRSRCEALLKKHRPEHELVALPSWKSLAPHRAELQKAAAIIIFGGPGYQPTFWPGVYPLLDELFQAGSDLQTPVIPMGLGWKGFPGDAASLDRYRFTETSLRALRHIDSHAPFLSCRDPFSLEVLKRHGLQRGLMTGCPVWYHLPSIGADPEPLTSVQRLLFTPAQRPLYREQSCAAMRMLARQFPHAETVCAFHRGLEADAFTSSEDAENCQAIAAVAREIGFKVEDVSGDLTRISFFKSMDLHVGYRVHAHIDFLSRRHPSILLHEDGRGRGVTAALGVPGIDAFRRTTRGAVLNRLLPESIGRGGALPGGVVASLSAVDELQNLLELEKKSGFARWAGVGRVIDAHYPVMQQFLAALP